ncbi:MAG: type II toxin-antitoxin system VapC family toxin [Pseudomonadota bacterium]|nr:type II toxin-antitoxin system VapC family toxin [Pseudomonadota bacterium]
MIRFLLDTNALSEPIRPAPAPRFLSLLEKHRGECAIASVTWHEAVYGLNRLPAGRRREALQEYLHGVVQTSLPVLPYDTPAAEWHGRERARLVAAGLTPSFPDGQIAAIAKTQGLVLITANHDDFKHFDGLELLSWLA